MLYNTIALTALTLIPSLTLSAQRVTGPEYPVSQVAKRTTVSTSHADELLASWLVAGSDSEVVIARLAVGKSQSAEVKKFAQMMLDEHVKLSSELSKFAAPDEKAEGAKPVDGKAKDDTKPLVRATADASGQRKPGAEGGFYHIALIRDLTNRCRMAQIEILEALPVADFDQGFMSAQVRAHAQAIIMVEVFCDYASDELRPTLERTVKTLRMHQDRATSLCKKCQAADGKPAGSSRK
jgi:predicted outer membrane protein